MIYHALFADYHLKRKKKHHLHHHSFLHAKVKYMEVNKMSNQPDIIVVNTRDARLAGPGQFEDLLPNIIGLKRI
jgi:hypothetical protein